MKQKMTSLANLKRDRLNYATEALQTSNST